MSYAPYMERPLNGGIQKRFRFLNGYGASVVQSPGSYGGGAGKWELAVIKFEDANDEWDLCYDTPVTDDVIGWLSWEEVENYLSQIEALQVHEGVTA